MTLKQKMGAGAGLALLLALALVAVVFLSLASLGRMERAGRAVLDARISEQRLVRTLNELLLSGGSSTVRQQARGLIPQLDAAVHIIPADLPITGAERARRGRQLPI